MEIRGISLYLILLCSVVYALLGSLYVESTAIKKTTPATRRIPVNMREEVEFNRENSNIQWPIKIPDVTVWKRLESQASNISFGIDDRIVNGQEVEITERPFQVHLGGCGGSLIANNFVLTAGHCILGKSGYRSTQWTVTAGSNDISRGYQYRNVPLQDIKIHPKWNGNINDPDIVDLALIYIEHPFTVSDKIQTIRLNDAYTNLQEMYATVSGWGRTEKTFNPNILSQTTMRIGGDISSNGMQVLEMPNTEGSGICKGDSGGPATIMHSDGTVLLVGVASYVLKKCGPGVNNGMGTYYDDAAYYVDVNQYISWITETMRSMIAGNKDTAAGLDLNGSRMIVQHFAASAKGSTMLEAMEDDIHQDKLD